MTVTTAVSATVTRAGHAGLHELQGSGLVRGNGLGDRREGRDIDLNRRGIEFVQRAHADATDDHAVDLFALKHRDWLAHAVSVVLVLIRYRTTVAAVGVYDHESRRRAKMSTNRALKSVVLFDWYTDFHSYFSFFIRSQMRRSAGAFCDTVCCVS